MYIYAGRFAVKFEMCDRIDKMSSDETKKQWKHQAGLQSSIKLIS